MMYTVEYSSGDPRIQRRVYSYEGASADSPQLHLEYTPANTAPTISVAPTVSYGTLTRLGPNNTPAVAAFEATDPEETGADALSYEVRTASGGGTLVTSGTCTSGVTENVNIAWDAPSIVEGTQTLYLVIDDGTASTEESFTLLMDATPPTVGTITVNPSPVTN